MSSRGGVRQIQYRCPVLAISTTPNVVGGSAPHVPQLMGALLPAWLLLLLVLVASTVATSTRADIVSMSRSTGTRDGSDGGSMRVVLVRSVLVLLGLASVFGSSCVCDAACQDC